MSCVMNENIDNTQRQGPRSRGEVEPERSDALLLLCSVKREFDQFVLFHVGNT